MIEDIDFVLFDEEYLVCAICGEPLEDCVCDGQYGNEED